MTTHIIREYDPQDIQAVEKCIHELHTFHHLLDPKRIESLEYASEYLKKLLKRCEEKTGKVFVVEIHEEIVGMISVLIEEDASHHHLKKHAHINDLIILPEHRGNGLSRMLLEKAEEYARSMNVTFIDTAVYLNNGKALKAYTRNGYFEHAIILRKMV